MPSQAEEALYALSRAYAAVYKTPEGKGVLDDICKRILGEGRKLLTTDQVALAARASNHDAAVEIRGMIDGVNFEKQVRPEVIKYGRR